MYKRLNYYPPKDAHMRDFLLKCDSFCTYKIDKTKLLVVFDLDTKEKEQKFEYEFDNFNWND